MSSPAASKDSYLDLRKDKDSPMKAEGGQNGDQRIQFLETQLTMVMDLLKAQQDIKKAAEAKKAGDSKSDVSKTMADIIGFDDFMANNRDSIQMENAGTGSIQAKDRDQLSITERTKVHCEATWGIYPKKVQKCCHFNWT
jgi:hypothetical protein